MSDQHQPKRPNLKVVKPTTGKPELPPARNFWNTCPLKKEFLPTSTCQTGKDSVAVPPEKPAPCEWSVNSEKHHFCFWKYINDQSYADGQMEEKMQNEIAQLLGISSTKVHFTLKDGIKKLKKNKGLVVLLDILRAKQHGESVSQGAFDELIAKMTDEPTEDQN